MAGMLADAQRGCVSGILSGEIEFGGDALSRSLQIRRCRNIALPSMKGPLYWWGERALIKKAGNPAGLSGRGSASQTVARRYNPASINFRSCAPPPRS